MHWQLPAGSLRSGGALRLEISAQGGISEPEAPISDGLRRDCVSRRARVYQGNLDLRRAGLRPPRDATERAGSMLVELLRARPAMARHLPGHLFVTAAARLQRLWRRWRRSQRHFYRDTSTR